jgi:hypothetical protein
MIPKSKGCSWLVRLAGRNTTHVAEKCCVLWMSSTLISQKQDFAIFITQFFI